MSESIGIRRGRPANLRAVGGTRELELGDDWSWLRAPAGEVSSPEALERFEVAAWQVARVPGTVCGDVLPHQRPASVDAWDHWYRTSFAHPGSSRRVLLCLDGLATLAEVWLNGSCVLRSDNMFVAHRLDVTALLRETNTLCLRFVALEPVLHARRPRGRWPTRLVSEKHLRFVRTTLLGRMPGWCPPWPPVGPWRPIRLVCEETLSVHELQIASDFADGRARFGIDVCVAALDHVAITGASVRVGTLGRWPLVRTRVDEVERWSLDVEVDAQPWWPHTHGDPVLYDVVLEFARGPEVVVVELEPVGFRSIRRVGARDDFCLAVNGDTLFCRGACWAPIDVATLNADPLELRRRLELVRAAGMNMLRIGGTMVYESDAFYRACDELGVLVWQDFMFANMDYPVDDEAFVASCRVEVEDLLARIGWRPCLAVVCGNSEVAQQSAMMGQPRAAWSNALFDTWLPSWCAELGVEVPYVSSSPSGGDLPFHVGHGVAHYYGVGAYRRPLDDVRGAGVKFASECLAFANFPATDVLQRMLGDAGTLAHHPLFRATVPRDPGAGWDFADVTDHYIERLFATNPAALRAADPERHLALGRVAVGEAMTRVLSTWRRAADPCAGALLWMLHDVQAGAGWGIIDVDGQPKPAYAYVKRILAAQALWFADAGLDGLSLHVANDGETELCGQLRVALLRDDGTSIERVSQAVRVQARGEACFGVDALLGHFADVGYSYRFGPPQHDVVVARFERDDGEPSASLRAVFLPHGLHRPMCDALGLQASARTRTDGTVEVHVRARRFAQAVAVVAPGYFASDDHFHVEPDEDYVFTLSPLRRGARLRATLHALNAPRPVVVSLETTA